MSWRRVWIAGVFGIPIVVLAMTLLLPPSRSSQCESRPSDGESFGRGFPLDRPFVEGRKVTIAKARADAGFPIYVPDHRLAGMDSLNTVWHENFGPHFNHVAFEFSSGIDIMLEPTAEGYVPYGYLEDIAELGPPAEVVFIHGVPASVYPANTVWNCRDHMSWTEGDSGVSVDLEGVNYSINGPYPAEDLVAVAKSLPVPDVAPINLPGFVKRQLGRICVSVRCTPLL